MNFGLTILTLAYIIFLIIPGVVFKRFFYQDNPQKSSGVGNFADRAISSLFVGFFIQTISILLFSLALYQIYGYDFADYYARAVRIHEKLVNDSLPTISPRQLSFILVELGLSLVLAGLFGLLGFNIIRKFKLDVMFPVLRFHSHWKYVFRDDRRIFDTDTINRYRVYDSAQVDVLVKESTGGSHLYSGMLYDYKVNKDGELAYVSLMESVRFSKKETAGPSSKKNVPGHLIVLPYSNVLNMNITYFYRAKESKSQLIEALSVVIIMLLLFSVLVLPWFAEVEWYKKVASVLILLYTWSSVVGLMGPLITTKKSTVGANSRVFMVVTFIITLWVALYLLGINFFNLF